VEELIEYAKGLLANGETHDEVRRIMMPQATAVPQPNQPTNPPPPFQDQTFFNLNTISTNPPNIYVQNQYQGEYLSQEVYNPNNQSNFNPTQSTSTQPTFYPQDNSGTTSFSYPVQDYSFGAGGNMYQSDQLQGGGTDQGYYYNPQFYSEEQNLDANGQAITWGNH